MKMQIHQTAGIFITMEDYTSSHLPLEKKIPRIIDLPIPCTWVHSQNFSIKIKNGFHEVCHNYWGFQPIYQFYSLYWWIKSIQRERGGDFKKSISNFYALQEICLLPHLLPTKIDKLTQSNINLGITQGVKPTTFRMKECSGKTVATTLYQRNSLSYLV